MLFWARDSKGAFRLGEGAESQAPPDSPAAGGLSRSLRDLQRCKNLRMILLNYLNLLFR